MSLLVTQMEVMWPKWNLKQLKRSLQQHKMLKVIVKWRQKSLSFKKKNYLEKRSSWFQLENWKMQQCWYRPLIYLKSKKSLETKYSTCWLFVFQYTILYKSNS